MGDHKVLVGFAMFREALEWLQGQVTVLGPGPVSSDEYVSLLTEAHGVILPGRRFGAAEMDLASRLLVIGRYGAGIDNIDVAAATERGLPVVYAPFGPTESTAEHAVLLIMATARRLPFFERAARRVDFGLQSRPELMGMELEGKVLGVVGYGRIGQRVAEICRDGLHMQVRAYDPFQEPEMVVACGDTCVTDLMALARGVDVLTVHSPFTPETRHLISRAVLRAMKPGALLVNTSRGPVVDEQALIEALQDGHLGGAGLDVFDPEPPPAGNPLLQMDNVVVTPHIGSFTEDGRRRMGMAAAHGVVDVLSGQYPKYLANPEVWERRRGAG
jgi:phosphoglycerate dehydrogenase-like enzyme